MFFSADLLNCPCFKFITVACRLVPPSERSGSGSTSSTRTPSGALRTSTSGRPARDTAEATAIAWTSGACATRDSPDQTATPAPLSRSVSLLPTCPERAACVTFSFCHPAGVLEGALRLGRRRRSSVAGAGGRPAVHRLRRAGGGHGSLLWRCRCPPGGHCRPGPARSKVRIVVHQGCVGGVRMESGALRR